ncbi:MAG: hypothetical protein ACKV1O_10375 [Saprospiraceae bacterium]
MQIFLFLSENISAIPLITNNLLTVSRKAQFLIRREVRRLPPVEE